MLNQQQTFLTFSSKHSCHYNVGKLPDKSKVFYLTKVMSFYKKGGQFLRKIQKFLIKFDDLLPTLLLASQS